MAKFQAENINSVIFCFLDAILYMANDFSFYLETWGLCTFTNFNSPAVDIMQIDRSPVKFGLATYTRSLSLRYHMPENYSRPNYANMQL